MKKFHRVLPAMIVMLWILYACDNPENRSVQPELFNNGWEFRIVADKYGPVADTTWHPVILPHTPRIEPLVVNDQWQGICVYRKTFSLPENDQGKRVWLKFEGAMNVAGIKLNGRLLATHSGGFLPFVVDLTEYFHFGKENTLEVRLDNTDNPLTGPKPLSQLDFNTYGGLYRNVWLILKNPLHLTDASEAGRPASGGIFVTYPEVSEKSARIAIKTSLRNSSMSEKSFVIRHRLFFSNQLTCDISTAEQKIARGDYIEVTTELHVSNPRLWSPGDPNLYCLETELITRGIINDGATTKIGIRRFDIVPDHFRINGKEMFLRGVNRHQEYPYIGYALSDEAQYRDARKIKEAGFDYVRLSHYPHSPAFLDACDELGLLVLDAIPGWQYFNEDIRFQEYAWQTCRDMIRRDRNHPCVLAWEVSLNETWMPESFIDEAIAIAKEEYPGDQCFTAGWMPYGYDIYLQARQHRLQHYEVPGKPYIVSEYGDWEYYAMNAGFNQDDWEGLLPEERSSRQLLSSGEARLLQQALNIQEAHNDNFRTPAFADGYWAMFDYNRGYAEDLEASGIMSIHRIPKFSYHFFRSQRSPQDISTDYPSGPVVFIASYWMESSSPEVRVFSNCEWVELSVNGIPVARQQPDSNRYSDRLAHPPFTFLLPAFTPGILEATGFISGKAVAKHSVATPGKPVEIKVDFDESGKSPVAGANDVIFVYAAIVDPSGTTVPVNEVPVVFRVEGDAEVLNPGEIVTEAGIAAALLRIGQNPGQCIVVAESMGLEPAQIVIHTQQRSELYPN